MSAPVYLDHAATTPVAPEVRAAMLPYLGEVFGNPSSAHAAGRLAREAVDEARARVGAAMGCAPAEVVFTSGGSEADNLALRGALDRHATLISRDPAAVLLSEVQALLSREAPLLHD